MSRETDVMYVLRRPVYGRPKYEDLPYWYYAGSQRFETLFLHNAYKFKTPPNLESPAWNKYTHVCIVLGDNEAVIPLTE